jgi:phosphatidylserine/phosphatidylglycerophosphate/cardiolipin synthase-like enzyme
LRAKSRLIDGVQVFAVAGTHAVSFGISASTAARQGLMGFAVDRTDLSLPTGAKGRSLPMLSSKVFKSEVGTIQGIPQKSMWKHPLQSFYWDDFGATPGHEYEYAFTPVDGTPGHIRAKQGVQPVPVRVRTEALFGDATHDVFFNRGVASSQAYAHQFHNKRPSLLPPKDKAKALAWLARGLDDAIFRFIASASKGDTLLCCFYEFTYQPVADALAKARRSGVKLRLIVDAKENAKKVKGKLQPPFPRTENLDTIARAHLPDTAVILREGNPQNFAHNKFMVLCKGKKAEPTEVWTGSTNITLGGITGQTNVGHWVRDSTVARHYRDYWEILSADPGAAKGDAKGDATKKKSKPRSDVESVAPGPKTVAVATGVTPIFSPRRGLAVLDLYVKLVDRSDLSAAITLAFGIGPQFKDQLKDNPPDGPIIFMLLEKRDTANPKSKQSFVSLNAQNNIYEAWGSYITDPVYQWVRETNNRQLKLNQHVAYIHSKFLMHDPLGPDPIVVTGSANFSKASTVDNDENMIVIRGDRRVADIYFTEFNRLFFHYYFRSVLEARKGLPKTAADQDSLMLDETGKKWMLKYAPGRLPTKRVEMFTSMAGAVQS